MRQEELELVIDEHKKWLIDNGGERADFRGANLRGANFSDTYLRFANFKGANFKGANLRNTNLADADLRGADFTDADFRGANFRGANLRGVGLDFSSGIPFYCGGTQIKGDRRLFAQMVFQLTRQDWQDLNKEELLWFQSIPERIKNSFCNYRGDIKEI